MASGPGFKTELFDQFARIGKALSSPVRLELLDFLCQGPCSVEGLADKTGLSMANTSQHLQQLKAARLADSTKAGQRVIYRLASPGVVSLLHALQGFAEEQLLEVQSLLEIYITGRDALEPVSLVELLDRVSQGDAVVLDVRPEEEYRSGHIPRALSIPLDQLWDRLDELPKGQDVIAYCRGPYCLLSVEAVELLRAKGFDAFRLEVGFPEWDIRHHETGVAS